MHEGYHKKKEGCVRPLDVCTERQHQAPALEFSFLASLRPSSFMIIYDPGSCLETAPRCSSRGGRGLAGRRLRAGRCQAMPGRHAEVK
jgi:hypothetical protein